ncbi:hypothetical protein HDV62DRAFT_70412 [Trichoderma sp. SZMC 28011]
MWGYPFPAPPRASRQTRPSYSTENSRLLSRLLGSRWNRLPKLCVGAYSSLASLFFSLLRPFDQRQSTAPPIPSFPPLTQQHFSRSLELLLAQPVYRILRRWNAVETLCPPRLAGIQGHRKKTYTASGRAAVSRLDHSQIHARKKPSKHSLATSISYTPDRHCDNPGVRAPWMDPFGRVNGLRAGNPFRSP